MKRTSPLPFLMAVVQIVLLLALAGCGASEAASTGGTSGPEEANASVSPTGAPRLVVGDPVAASWIDKYLYLAKIEKMDGSAITVRYADDQSTRTVDVTEVRGIPARAWKPGEKVLASWSTGRFCEGEIKSRVNTITYEIKWSDGAAASDVNYRRIITREP
jgi:hypothetical protein